MCNTCHTNYNNGCYGVATQGTTNTSSCFGCGQRICRDCCGNILVRRNACGCNQTCNTCCQQNCCQNGGGGATDTSNGSGLGYGCFTICGRISHHAQTNATTADTTDFDGYYARQYGLYPYGRRSRCCCGTNGDNN